MCNHTIDCLTCWDIILVILGAFLSAVATIILIKLFKPHICFELPYLKEEKDLKVLKLPVKNLNCHFAAVNLRIETAVVLNDFTYHFDLDRQDFIMLSKNDGNIEETPYRRVYQAYAVSEFTKIITENEVKVFHDLLNLLKKDNAFLRIRVHASHEFTGFGKAFEARFKFTNGSFVPLNQKNICMKAALQK